MFSKFRTLDYSVDGQNRDTLISQGLTPTRVWLYAYSCFLLVALNKSEITFTALYTITLRLERYANSPYMLASAIEKELVSRFQ